MTVLTYPAQVACLIAETDAAYLASSIHQKRYTHAPPKVGNKHRRYTKKNIVRLTVWKRLVDLGFYPKQASALSVDFDCSTETITTKTASIHLPGVLKQVEEGCEKWKGTAQ